MMAKRIPTGDSVPGGLGLPKAGMDAIQKRVAPGALSDPDVALYYVAASGSIRMPGVTRCRIVPATALSKSGRSSHSRYRHTRVLDDDSHRRDHGQISRTINLAANHSSCLDLFVHF